MSSVTYFQLCLTHFMTSLESHCLADTQATAKMESDVQLVIQHPFGQKPNVRTNYRFTGNSAGVDRKISKTTKETWKYDRWVPRQRSFPIGPIVFAIIWETAILPI